MARNQVIVSITGDSRGLQKALGGAESTLSKFGKAAGVAVAAVGVLATALSVKAVKSASALEQAMGGLGAVFKDQFEVMADYANAAAKSVGLAKSEYASLATVLGSQLKNMGVSTDQLASKTNDLVVLGADLAAQFGGSTSDAVSALSALLRGERDPIERYGVSINEAAVKAKMAEMGLSGLSGEAEKNAKLQATLALLTQQTADAQGAFARESTTLAGAWQRFRAGVENLSATYGNALLPAVTAVTAAMGVLLDLVSGSSWFSTFIQATTQASVSIQDFIFGVLNGEKTLSDLDLGGTIQRQLQGVADFIANGGIERVFEGLANTRDALMQAMLKALPGIVDAITKFVPPFVIALIQFIAEGVKLIVGAAPALMQAAVTMLLGIVQALDVILPELVTAILDMLPDIIIAAQQAFTGLLNGLTVIIPQLITTLSDLLPQIVVSLLAMIPTLQANAIPLWMALVTAVTTILPALIEAVTGLMPGIVETLTAMLPDLIDGGIELFEGLIESVSKALPPLLTAVVSMMPRITAALISLTPLLILAGIELFVALVRSIPQAMPAIQQALRDSGPVMKQALLDCVPLLVDAGRDLIGGLIRGIGDKAKSVVESAVKVAKDAVNAVKGFLGIKSPSRVFRSMGQNIGAGLALGVKGSYSLVDAAMAGLNNRVVDGFSASLTGPEISSAVSSYGISSSAQAPTVINVTFESTMAPTAEDGRRVAEALRFYTLTGGRAA